MTDEERRPSPESLLKLAEEEERRERGGKLKIFFGMCPGVGKTYAMLEAARQRRAEGVDVVVGLAETHGRAETQALLEGLESLPRRTIQHHGMPLGELDLDAALARRPRLLLVDELAHTNAPGLRHRKRWQDVEELLGAGIDVYTTLNVQHWESLNDVVARITGRAVRETVPDTFLQRADDLELVDLSPGDLLQRLREGKVYRGPTADRAADSFFQPGNLIALRELALRHAAERVELQLLSFRERHEQTRALPVAERLLVGVSSGPMTARLIRATARLAARLHSAWLAVYVETPAELKLPPRDRARVVENLRLAETLGAETLTRSGQRVPDELLALAQSRSVTKIVLGKPARPRWKELLRGSVVNEMARRCGEIDLYVISGVGADLGARRQPFVRRPAPYAGLSWAAAAVAGCTLLSWWLSPFLDRSNLIMLYLGGVAWLGYRHGRTPSLAAAVLSVLAFDFFFVPPSLTFAVADAQYLVTFAVMLGVGVLISSLTERLRRQGEQMRRREDRLRTLYRLSLELSETPEPKRLLEKAQRHLEEFYRVPVVLIARGEHGALVVAAGDAARFSFDEPEAAVAHWVLDHGVPAGAATDTLGSARGLYVPLRGLQSTVGVLGVRPADPEVFVEPEQVQLLEAFAAAIGGALESTRMSEAAGRSEMLLELRTVQTTDGAPPLRLADFLAEARILRFPPAEPPERILESLLGTLRLPNPAQALQAVLEREKSGSTFIGSGVSIPHARLPGLTGIQAALGLSPEGPIRVWALFVAPAEDPEMTLDFLAGLAAFFRASGNVEKLLELETPAEILAFVRSCGPTCDGRP